MTAVDLKNFPTIDTLLKQKEILFLGRLIFVGRIPSQVGGMNIHADINVYKTVVKIVFYISKMTSSEGYNLLLMRPDAVTNIKEKEFFWACIHAQIIVRPTLNQNELASCVKMKDNEEQACFFPEGCQIEYLEKKPKYLTIKEDDKNLLMTKIKEHISNFFCQK